MSDPYADLIDPSKKPATADPYADLIDHGSHGASRSWGVAKPPSYLQRLKAGAQGIVEHPGELLKGIVTAPVTSATAIVAPTKSGAEEYNTDDLSQLRNVARFGREVHAQGVTGKERAEGAIQTAANILAPGMGPIRGGMLAGAAYDPEDPLVGAALGGAGGAVLHGAGKAVKGAAPIVGKAATAYHDLLDGGPTREGVASAREFAKGVHAKLPTDPLHKITDFIVDGGTMEDAAKAVQQERAAGVEVPPQVTKAAETKAVTVEHVDPDQAHSAFESPAPTDADVAMAGSGERFSGIPLPSKAIQAGKVAYRSAMTTPYAEIEGQAPALAEALTKAGASRARAEHIATRRMGRVLSGLSDQQKADFGTKLVYDNLVAEADRKGQAAMQTSDPVGAAELSQAAQNFETHAKALEPRVPQGIDQEPWFQQALGTYKQQVEGPLTQDAIASGVDPNSLRQPQSAYVRLASESRLDDAEIRKALDVAGVSDPSELKQRPKLLRKLIGENPALKRYFVKNASGARQGPLAANAGYPGEPRPTFGQRTGVTGSSKMAQGTAQSYATDVGRIVGFDAPDKAVKAARNQIFAEVAKVGRELGPDEAPTFGKKVLAFDDKKGLATGDEGIHRFEVTPEVADAVRKFLGPKPQPSAAMRSFKGAADLATRAQIAGMPVEATSHANTLASIVGSIPGEKDVTGKVVAAVPGAGGKLAAIREMKGIDFGNPEIQALENRLADIGALRPDVERGGLINTSHHWLFGPEGIDVRGRLVLARKYLARNPQATDAELREFITSKLGNYISENAGALPNFLAKGSVLSPFARFQTARIPTAIKTTVGVSGLPSRSVARRIGTVANTLYRGPVGYAIGAELANRALSGHSTKDNEAGHPFDIETGLYAVPGGIKRMSSDEAKAKYGDKAVKLYIPAATLNPVFYAGARALGIKAGVQHAIPQKDEDGNVVQAPGYLGDAARDAENVVLGMAGPAVRGGMTALTGTQPYLQRDNTFLRVAPREPDKTQEMAEQWKAALGLANPAAAAFTDPGGDASRRLSGAMAQDAKPLGGVPSALARVAEFTMPRVLSPSVGGKSNAQSLEAQADRDYSEALLDYKRRIQSAPGPVSQRKIMDEASAAFSRAGYDPNAVVVALEQSIAKDHEAVADQNRRNVQRRMDKRR